MLTTKLTIVPVTLDPITDEFSSNHSPQYSDAARPICVKVLMVSLISFRILLN